ncbi:TerC family protein [Schauerella aestuarii]|uniref:TerC family protein n=1 Tax=Schauerella aestuarii TaxID=2511204 RepID=UPI00136A4EAF|nr:TerC family protein [Achromobacter aestuarii]MYZ44621.1 TerC family protein [Achromobacter aestuarii]
MFFDWMADPTAWLGLATLIVLEVVLGIDNLVFIAILADKLPEHQRNRARMIGLSLALIMRLGLLASIAWVVTLTAPLFTLFGMDFSGRDLILIFGGLFLLFKGTMELHERLEGAADHVGTKRTQHAVFWHVIAQIVVLDAVFSLDSVITAVGMVEEISIMMTAVIFAMALMMVASRPLMAFVSRHPTVVILCLGLLLMIGFSLVAEGLDFHIPKGYLYAAIGFAILIEACNQLARRNRIRTASAAGRRDRTAQAVLRLLAAGRDKQPDTNADDMIALVGDPGDEAAFAPEESTMIERVLAIGTRDVRAIMVPRGRMTWLDVADTHEDVLRKFALGHSRLPLCEGEPGNVVGVVHFKDALIALQQPGPVDLVAIARQPRFVTETTPVLKLLEQIRVSRDHMLIVVDEHGQCEGLVTPMDVLTAVGGDLPEHDTEYRVQATRMVDGSWLLDGRLSIDEARRELNEPELARPHPDATLAGYLLRIAGRIPDVGEIVTWNGWRFEITRRDRQRVDQVRAMAPDFVLVPATSAGDVQA